MTGLVTDRWQALWQDNDRPCDRLMTGPVTGRWQALWQADHRSMTVMIKGDDRLMIDQWLSDNNQKTADYQADGSLCTWSEGRAQQSPHSRCWSRWTWMWDMNVVRLFILIILGAYLQLGSLVIQRLLSSTNYKRTIFIYDKYHLLDCCLAKPEVLLIYLSQKPGYQRAAKNYSPC